METLEAFDNILENVKKANAANREVIHSLVALVTELEEGLKYKAAILTMVQEASEMELNERSAGYIAAIADLVQLVNGEDDEKGNREEPDTSDESDAK